MTKYINADKLLERVRYVYENSRLDVQAKEDSVMNEAVYAVLSMILLDAPAENVAPATFGEWVWHESEYEYECSACGCRFNYNHTLDLFNHGFEYAKYCPNCGAMMMRDV